MALIGSNPSQNGFRLTSSHTQQAQGFLVPQASSWPYVFPSF